MYIELVVRSYCEIREYDRLPSGSWNIRDIAGDRMLVEIESENVEAFKKECESVCPDYIQEILVTYVEVDMEYGASIGCTADRMNPLTSGVVPAPPRDVD